MNGESRFSYQMFGVRTGQMGIQQGICLICLITLIILSPAYHEDLRVFFCQQIPRIILFFYSRCKESKRQDFTKIFNPLWEFSFQVQKNKLSYLKTILSYGEKFRVVICRPYQGLVRKVPVLVQKIPSLGKKSTTLGIWERREGR